MMDDTIRLLLETDANAENKRSAAAAEGQQLIQDAKQAAAAHSEAMSHHTKDLIFEIEETERTEYEKKYRALLAEYESKTAELTHRFDEQHEVLLADLMEKVLKRAEHSYGN